MNSDNPFDNFIYTAKKYIDYMSNNTQEDSELRNQFFEEPKKLEGKNNMAELTWIEEYFRNKAVYKGIAAMWASNYNDIQKATNMSIYEREIL